MRKTSLLIATASIVLALAASSCGKKDYSGSLGSCTFTTGGLTTCFDMSYTGNLKDDPKTEAATSFSQSCSAQSGTTGTGECSATGAVGKCVTTASATKSGESYTITTNTFFGTGYDSTTATAACSAMSGTFTAL